MPFYKDKNNRYLVKISINGRQICRRKYLGRPILTKEEAIKCEKSLYLSYSELGFEYNINDLFDIFEEYLFKKYKETSAQNYLYNFNAYIKPYFIDKKVSEITRNYCDYVNDSINDLKFSTINYYVFITRIFVVFLSKFGCTINPSWFYTFKKNRINKVRWDFYTEEEFKKLISKIELVEDKLLFSLLFYYGLRIGELRALKVSDFRNDRILIEKSISNKGRGSCQKVYDTKTNSSIRSYPYVLNVRSLFEDLVKKYKLKSCDYVFKSKWDKSLVIGETTIRRKLIEYCNKAKIKVIKIHEFRHSCATYLINKDVDPKDIANWLGHSTYVTTLRVYSHLLPIRKEKVKSVFNDLKLK